MLSFFLLASAASLQPAPPLMAAPLDPTSQRVLAAHNRERAIAGVPPLAWDRQLAASALSYGPALAALGGRLQHSPKAARHGQRENLWRGSAGRYMPEQMVGSWIEEKRHFRPDVFPAVSATGHWGDVAHYTQVVWRTTTRVGCAIYRSGPWDYLICRYSPPGNIDNKRAF